MISEELRATLAKHDQQHLLKYYDAGLLTEEQKASLESQLQKIDFDRLKKIYDVSVAQTTESSSDSTLEPMDSITDVEKLSEDEKAAYQSVALDAISRGEIGLVLMAGGQGTRLGCSYPKGMYDISLPSHKSLFQLQAERILRVQEMAAARSGKACVVPWYVMTSPMTHAETLAYILLRFI
ncbi:uncharacterized protein [Blastocystis hominis]|uniref:UDP-N-acetylglucosamine diphosphorylase n=1 Tax=Blastocystis hominis TaxID=12968 RepID=D8M1N5_BLAHO|nr:uncharacterized protein [Blastocystis hominis]CBK21974.2 unnamed protein product [Blastocystis hominis]|eukprot:XP_012896022.1 uncharacterized protein [Blastocystis hominis]